MSACYRASLPTTHPALTPLGFSNLLNFPPATGASVEHRVRNGTESLREPPGAPPRYSSSELLSASPSPEQAFRAGLAAIPGHDGDSVRDCRRSQARTAIPCGTVADPSDKLRFRMSLSTIPSRNGDSVWNCRRSQARTAILCESGVLFEKRRAQFSAVIFRSVGGKFRVLYIYTVHCHVAECKSPR